MKTIIFLFIGSLFLLQVIEAQSLSGIGKIKAAKVLSGPPAIDGILDDQIWKDAPSVTEFTQRELTQGAKATERTEVRIVYDDDNLYLGIWCFDSEPQNIVASELSRDFSYGTDDNFKIIIDTYRDRRNGFLFITNPNGAMYDALITDEGNGINSEWNGLWTVKTSRNGQGWFAEFEIPFSTLRFSSDSLQVWGINFERNIRSKREQVLWQGWLRNYYVEKLSQAGELDGLYNVKRKNIIEVKPYISGGIQRGFYPFSNDRTNITKAGGDIKMPLSTTMTMDMTVNTDFAQVEADHETINLSRFPLYFPEKREFFLEGSDIFSTQFGDMIRPFYSRRIGLSPDRRLVPIYGGIRLIGKQDRSDVGFLSMQTAEKYGEPLTNYTVARLKQEVFESSYVGFMATNKQSALSYNRLLAADGLWSNNNVFGSNTVQIGGALAATFSPDQNKNNLAYRFYVDYPNNFIDHFIGIASAQKGFNPELGFISRNDFKKISWYLVLQPRPEGFGIQYFQFKPMDIDYYMDNNGVLQSLYYEGRILGFRTNSGEWTEINFQRTADRLIENFEVLDGAVIPPGLYWWNDYELQFGTNESRMISASIFYNWGGYYQGSKRALEIYVSSKLSKHISFSTDYTRRNIELPGGSFVTHEISSSINCGISTKLNMSLYSQWNNESGDINFNFRIHWIPNLGSDVYLVYNHLYDMRENGMRPVIAVLQLKVSYYIPVSL